MVKMLSLVLAFLLLGALAPAQAHHITGAPVAPFYAPFFTPLGGTNKWWVQVHGNAATVCEQEYLFPPTHTAFDPSPGFGGLCFMEDGVGPGVYPATDYVRFDMSREGVSAGSSAWGLVTGQVDFYCQTGSFLTAVAPGAGCFVNRNYLVANLGHAIGYVTKVHPGSGLILSTAGDVGKYTATLVSSAAASTCPAGTTDVSGGTGNMCVGGAPPTYPAGQFGFHSVSFLGFKTFAVNGISPGWSCFHPTSGAVTSGSVVPTPEMTCYPPVAVGGAVNACRRIGEYGYSHMGTGGGILITTTCSGGLTSSLAMNLPSPDVTTHTWGLTAAASVACKVTENSVFLATDWWAVCRVNLNF